MKTQGETKERKILWLSFGMGLIFAVTELILAVVTHSQSVLMDGAYDSAELVIIGLTLFLTPLFYLPLSEKRPFGYAQVESIFIIIKGFMLLSVSLGLSIGSLQQAFSGGNIVDGKQVSFFQVILGLASLAVLGIMRHWNKGEASPIVRAEIYGWKIDAAYSLGMAGAFFGSTFLGNTPLSPVLPYFDQLIAVCIVVFMLPENIKMLWRALRDVFLFSPEKDVMDQIKSTCNPILEAEGFKGIFYDVIRTGRKLWIGISIAVEGETIAVAQLHKTYEALNKAILLLHPEGDVDLVVNGQEQGQQAIE